MTHVPLGLRNNNPGNIELNDTRWQGMAVNQNGDDQERFVKFDHAKWGIRAIARILITYQDKRRAADGSPIDTIQEVIERWAPPFENPTNDYAAYIANTLRLSAYEHIDIYDYETMFKIVQSIIHFENGQQPYDDATINQGLRLAGIDVPVKSLSKSRTIKAASTATAATSATVIIEALNGAQAIIEPLIPYVDVAQYVMLALTMISIGVTVWVRVDDLKKDARP